MPKYNTIQPTTHNRLSTKKILMTLATTGVATAGILSLPSGKSGQNVEAATPVDTKDYCATSQPAQPGDTAEDLTRKIYPGMDNLAYGAVEVTQSGSDNNILAIGERVTACVSEVDFKIARGKQ